LVSHGVAKRGWNDVRKGEVCKIPGVGPVSPEVARDIGKDAFLNGLFYDGTDLRQFKRWTKHIPVEVAVALELGDPPEFDGVTCVDCGIGSGPSSITSSRAPRRDRHLGRISHRDVGAVTRRRRARIGGRGNLGRRGPRQR
jgi:hypothetical protein